MTTGIYAGIAKGIGGLGQAGSSIYAGYLQKDLYETMEEASEAEAEYQEALARFKAQRTRRRGERVIGTQKARLAAQGQDITEGSTLESLADSMAELELDVYLQKHRGRVRADQARYRAGMYGARGEVAMSRGIATGTRKMGKLLTGMSKWDWFKSPGARGGSGVTSDWGAKWAGGNI